MVAIFKFLKFSEVGLNGGMPVTACSQSLRLPNIR